MLLGRWVRTNCGLGPGRCASSTDVPPRRRKRRAAVLGYAIDPRTREAWRNESLGMRTNVEALLSMFFDVQGFERAWSLTLKPIGVSGAARLETRFPNEPGERRRHVQSGAAAVSRREMREFGSWLTRVTSDPSPKPWLMFEDR